MKEVFSTKHVIQSFLITRRKVREDVAKAVVADCRLGMIPLLLILFLDVSSRNSTYQVEVPDQDLPNHDGQSEQTTIQLALADLRTFMSGE